MDERNKHAQRAIYARALAASVFLVEPNESLDLSSGTLVQTPGRNIVVLTAAHCLEDYAQYPDRVLLGFSGEGEPTAGLVRECHTHPDVDVGVVVLQAYPDPIRERAWTLAALDDEAPDPTRHDLLVVGFPSAGTVIHGKWLGLGSYQYWTSGQERVVLENGRWSIRWKEGEGVDHSVSARAPELFRNEQLSKLDRLQGRVFDLPHPRGMSGGGCWSVAAGPTSREAVWHPGRNLHLAAVQTSYKEPHIILEPKARWNSWLAEVFRDLDRVA